MTVTATPLRVLLVGRGKVARGLSRGVSSRGTAVARMRALSSVTDADLRWAQLVLLAVPDAAIRAAAEALALRAPVALPVLHLSGNRLVSEASACREHGALHPLASFASRQHPPSMEGVSFALAGTPRAQRLGKRFVRALGGKLLKAPSQTPLQGPSYHAAAALVANGGAALAASGIDILVRLGADRTSAQHGIASLLRSVADNVDRVGVPHALTGPIVRGDAATVAQHRAALRALGGPGLGAYDGIAEAILGCAIDAGLSEDAARQVRSVLRSRERAAH